MHNKDYKFLYYNASPSHLTTNLTKWCTGTAMAPGGDAASATSPSAKLLINILRMALNLKMSSL